jgi:hypothetical protein
MPLQSAIAHESLADERSLSAAHDLFRDAPVIAWTFSRAARLDS